MNQTDFEWLVSWYQSYCDGDWEHSSGITIRTLDNPGWVISINLEGTELEDIDFEKFEKKNSETDWLVCFTENMKFKGYCGTLNLPEVLQIFQKWTEKHQALLKTVKADKSSTHLEYFNAQNNQESCCCRICGLNQSEPPWRNDDNFPSFDICDCCGVTFGYQDCILEGVISYRKEWFDKKNKWFFPKATPPDWSLEEQMKNIPEAYK